MLEIFPLFILILSISRSKTHHRPGANSFLGHGSVHKQQSIFGENHTYKIHSKSFELFKHKKEGQKAGQGFLGASKP